MKYESHPIADLFPLMEGKDFDELVENIKSSGFNPDFPIVLYQGKILDGRNRQRASETAGIEPRYFTRDDLENPFTYVATANLHRRHLSTEQRAFIASAMANMNRGDFQGNQYTKSGIPRSGNTKQVSRTKATKIMQVSEGAYDRARSIERHGVPELVQATKSGKIALTPAAEIARLPKEQQVAALAKEPKKKARARTPKGHRNGKHPPKSDEYLRKPIETKLRKLGKIQLSNIDHNFDPDWEKQFNTNYTTAWSAWYKAMQERLAWEPPWDHISEKDLAMLVTRLFDTWQGWRKSFPDIPIAELIRMTAVRLHQKFSI
jgi:hypothetical protein